MPRIRVGRPRTERAQSPRTQPRTQTHTQRTTTSTARASETLPAPPLQTSQPGARAIDAHITFARVTTKSAGPEGKEPLLSAREAARVRDVLDHASPAIAAHIVKLVALPEHAVGGALVLRAVSARASLLVDTDHAPRALATIEEFAQRIKTMGAAELLRRATVIDLDSTQNTSRFDPLDLWKTSGTVRDPTVTPDDDADNDGLFQRFTGSCGPTTLQMMLAEADPITAFAIHDDVGGVASDATHGSTARFQSEMLDGEALGRAESLLRSRVHNALGRMRARGDVSHDDVRALDRYLFAAGAPTAGSERALTKLRAAHQFPGDDDVKRLRARPLLKSDSGMTTEALLADLNAAVATIIGARYTSVEFGRGGATKHLDAVARALKQGLDVPFGVAEPPHWLLLTAVRGKKPERELLVSDPDSGSTVWVKEQAFARGSFVAAQLHIERPGDRPYVDTLLLPARAR